MSIWGEVHALLWEWGDGNEWWGLYGPPATARARRMVGRARAGLTFKGGGQVNFLFLDFRECRGPLPAWAADVIADVAERGGEAWTADGEVWCVETVLPVTARKRGKVAVEQMARSLPAAAGEAEASIWIQTRF